MLLVISRTTSSFTCGSESSPAGSSHHREASHWATQPHLAPPSPSSQVNVWLIGKPQPLLSLQGHQSRVECVTLDRAEEVVVAGSQGGTVKLWDLEEARAVRTLTGHRTSCCAIDFHPFG